MSFKAKLYVRRNKQQMLNVPTVTFAVCEPFDFPKPSLLMTFLQHET